MAKLVEVRPGLYYDSVKLMLISKAIDELDDVVKASVVMGTKLNKENLMRQNMDDEKSRAATSSDLIISIEAHTETGLEQAVRIMEDQLARRTESWKSAEYRPQSIASAIRQQPESNVAIVSVPGQFAAEVTESALDAGLHVMLFSDNVTIEEERHLKEKAREHGLIVMGPDCGTALINGTPLCFANVVSRGPIGLVSASGTGSQEVMSLLDDFGVGISHCIGTGGRDLSEAVGGISFLQGLSILNNDPQTEVIVLISKPPSDAIAQKIRNYIRKNVTKPVVIDFIGAQPPEPPADKMHFASSLEECALVAAALAEKRTIAPLWSAEKIEEQAAILRSSLGNAGGRLRACYSGGTLAYEAEILLGKAFDNLASNLGSAEKEGIGDPETHIIIDYGSDEYTGGRAHPMIDSTLRAQAYSDALADSHAGIILLDFVLGYGASAKPHADFIKIRKESDARIPTIAVIVGTDRDPQGRQAIENELRDAGFIVAPSNKAAIDLIIRTLENKECQ